MPNTDHEVLIRKLSVKLHDKEIRELCELCAEHEEQEFLYGLMFSGEKRVGDNAAWVLNHVTKEDGEWLNERRDEMIDAAIKTPSVTRRRFLLSLLERQNYSADAIRPDFLNACFAWLMSDNEPPGVRSTAIKLAYKQCYQIPELLDELHYMLGQLDTTKLSTGVKCAIKKIIG